MTATMPTLYQRCKRIAAPIVKHCHADLTEHDRKQLGASKAGDVYVWAPRDCGTWLWLVSTRRDTAADLERCQMNLRWFNAVELDTAQTWFLVEATSDRRGTVSPIDTAAARRLFTNHIEVLERLPRQAAA